MKPLVDLSAAAVKFITPISEAAEGNAVNTARMRVVMD